MAALIQFVDNISTTPTVRLDVNDGVSWFCQSFKAPPPRLRRSVSQNAMRDGEHVSSSLYEARVLELELTLIKEASEELAATEMQKLWRELDRATNILRYQPDALTKPVFFCLSRSDAEDVEELWTAPIARTITLSLFAEPFALGLKESLGPFTVNNNPIHASNPTYFDVSTAIGDVAAPLTWWDSASASEDRRIVATQHMPTAILKHIGMQAEDATLGTDTTNPGGGPDAAMSGTGVNNHVRTSFATASMTTRLTVAPGDISGSWRVLAFVRRTGTSSTLTARVRREIDLNAVFTGQTITIPATASTRLMIDLGVVGVSDAADKMVGYSQTTNNLSVGSLAIQAARSGGSDALDWDVILLLPAGGQYGSLMTPSLAMVDVDGHTRALLDTAKDVVAPLTSAGDPTTGGTTIKTGVATLAGALPYILPNQGNRYHVIPVRESSSRGTSALSSTLTVTLAYWPRYLFVRPSAT